MVTIMGISVATLSALIAWISIFFCTIKLSSMLFFLAGLHKFVESAVPSNIEDRDENVLVTEAILFAMICLMIDQLLMDMTICVLILVAIQYGSHLLLLPWLVLKGVVFVSATLILFCAACSSLLGRNILPGNSSAFLFHTTTTAGNAVVWYTVFLLYQQYKQMNSNCQT